MTGVPLQTVPAPPGGGKWYLEEDVKKHNKSNDCWIILHNEVYDVTEWLGRHPGGRDAIMTYAGKDATVEWDTIHQRSYIQKYVPNARVGSVTKDRQVVAAQNLVASARVDDQLYCPLPPAPSSNGASSAFVVVVNGNGSAPAASSVESQDTNRVISMDEVRRHTSEGDIWIILHGKVYDVTEWVPRHPGGSAAIMPFAGKDATVEWDAIHQPSYLTQSHYSHKFVKLVGFAEGASSSGGAGVVVDVEGGGLHAPLLPAVQVDPDNVIHQHYWGEARSTVDEVGTFGAPLSAWMASLYFVIKLVLVEVASTILVVKNWDSAHDRSGLSRAAFFMIVFVVIHCLGNLHIFGGALAFNGYGYFLNHPVPWGTLMAPVEIYLLAAGALHVGVALLRTYKYKSVSMLAEGSAGVRSLWMAATGTGLLIFLVTHLLQFRLKPSVPQYRFRAQWMYPFYCDNGDEACAVVGAKDLYRVAVELFESRGWVLFYVVGVVCLGLHLREGWGKLTSISSAIPQKHKSRAHSIGSMMVLLLVSLYSSYALYAHYHPITDLKQYSERQPELVVLPEETTTTTTTAAPFGIPVALRLPGM